MKQQTLKAIVPAFAIAFILCASIFVSCENCELDNEYTVVITVQPNAVDMHGPLWASYTSTQVHDAVLDTLRRQFGPSSNTSIVTTAANVHVFIDSIITDSYEWDETREDPCYGDHGWMYQLAFPPDHTTYRLHLTAVTIVYTVVDSVHMTTGWGRAKGTNTEWLSQPAGDSTHCYQYEVVGDYSNGGAITLAACQAFQNLKCEIKKMMEP